MLLASATPSLESYYYAQRGLYQLLEMPERYGNAVLPTVDIVDMNQERAQATAVNSAICSPSSYSRIWLPGSRACCC